VSHAADSLPWSSWAYVIVVAEVLLGAAIAVVIAVVKVVDKVVIKSSLTRRTGRG